MTPIAPLIETFLRDTLACQRGASRHTSDSYASSFQLLFVFAADRLKVKPSALTLEQIDAGLVSAFLEHLEDKRKNAAVTRNVRLAAIKSFFRFLEYRQPAALEQIRRVLAIPFKKTDTRLVPYLLRDELQAVLDAPDPATRDGIRDRAMLHVAVCAGLRVSELTGLKVDDIDLPSMSIRVLGKGRRERTLPLWKPAAAALRAWLAIRGQVATPEVFVNARGEPLSRWGFAYLLKQHAATAARKQPGLAKKRVSPHVLRHTCAMIVLQATGDIRKVSLWLGHATLTTTEVYTRGDPTEKLDAMEAIVPPHLRRGVFQPTDKLIALLKSVPRNGELGWRRLVPEQRSSCRQLPITGFAHKAANGRRPLPAATGTARSVRALPRASGSPSARPICCRCRIFMWSTRCRPSSRDIAYQNKAVIYDLLMKASAETTLTIAADPKHLGARIGIIAVLHTWGSALTHHPARPHDRAGRRPVAGWLEMDLQPPALPRARASCCRACSAGCFWTMLIKAHTQGRLQFFGDHAALADKTSVQAIPGAAAQDRMGGLHQGPVRRARAGVALSVALHPPRRHLQSPSASRPTTTASPSAGRTIASMDPTAGRR